MRSDAVETSELNDPARRLGALVMAAVDDRKGVDPMALDVSKLTELTDTMVIVTGTSNRHVKAIVDNVLLVAKRSGAEVLGTEGREHNDWVLIDLADVVVHVMSTDGAPLLRLGTPLGATGTGVRASVRLANGCVRRQTDRKSG